MHFEFATANRIIFGPGTIRQVPEIAASFGQRLLVVVDSQERGVKLLDGLSSLGLYVFILLVDREPDVDSVLLATRNAREFDYQTVIGFGGGSTLDTGKAVAAFMNNPGDPLNYLEVVGSGQKLENPSIPYIAIPTTAGTGSEVTRNAVFAVKERRIKVSLRSPFLLPRIAVVDPENTYSMPPSITASTGLDALTQLIEPFVCNSPTPLTDTLCKDGIARIAGSLRNCCENPLDLNARENMALASLYGGIALANARLGAVHGMAAAIGGMYPAPHGAVCACLLPIVIETNLHALRTREPDSPAVDRYGEAARLLTGEENANGESGAAWIKELCQALNIRPLKEYGVKSDDFPVLVAQSQKASSMRGNPIDLTDAELITILEQAI